MFKLCLSKILLGKGKISQKIGGYICNTYLRKNLQTVYKKNFYKSVRKLQYT